MKKTVFFADRLPGKSTWGLFLIVLASFLSLLSGCAPAAQPTQAMMQVSIEVDGKQISVKVPAGSTTQAALDQGNITLNTLDRINPPSYTVLKEKDVVQVTRVREVFNVKEVTIPFERKTLNNETLPEGQTLLVQQGVNGTEQVTYRQVFENDKEVSNIVFKSEVMVEPLPEIIMVGVQKPFTPIPIPGKLAYLAGGSAWLMETTTGNRRPLVTTGDLDGRVFKLSPKGDWLLFSRAEKKSTEASSPAADRINSLWAIDLTDKNAQPANLKVYNIIHFADWVPGKGLTITYSTVEPRSTAPGWQANNDLQMLTFAPTGAAIKEETILDTNDGGYYGWWGMDFAWSQDGTLLAFARPDEIGLVDFKNKTTRPLITIMPFQTGSDWAWVPGMSWSPDHNVLFTVNHAPKAGIDSQEASPLFDLSGITINADTLEAGGPLISIIPQAGMFAYPVAAPIWKGASYPVAFLQAIFPEQSDSKRYRLVIMDRDGSNQAQVFPAEDRQGLEPQHVSWSPQPFGNDQMWLALIYQGNIWFVNADTGESQQVTGDGLITHLDWK